MDRKAALAEIWRKTHRDFKGKTTEGVKRIMVFRNGSTIVPLEELTDAEIVSRVPAYQP